MVASMKPDDRARRVVMPHGVLFRGGAEKAIRTVLARGGPAARRSSGCRRTSSTRPRSPPGLLIFRGAKPAARRGHVLFVDGSKRFSEGRNQNQMAPEDVEAIVAAYRTVSDPDGEAGVGVRLVPLAEIEGNGFDLNIGRYLRGAAEEVVDVETALAELREAQAAFANRGRNVEAP